MKWITHQTGAVAACLALDLPILVVGASWAGAILPDMIDQSICRMGGKKKRQKIFNKIHRGDSHWFGWWLFFFILALMLQWPPPLDGICAGLAFGALCHVFMDMLTPRGIPLFPFGAKGHVALPVCSTGGIGEYVFLGLIIVCAALFMGERILLSISRASASAAAWLS